MELIEIPEYEPKIVKKKEQLWIFDKVRKKYLLLKPEEWVRQQFICFLTEKLNYPETRISVEKQLIYQKRKKRIDILVYDKEIKPLILVECKSPNIQISENTLQQAITYNFILQSPWLVLTNGFQGAILNLNEKGEYEPKTQLPQHLKA